MKKIPSSVRKKLALDTGRDLGVVQTRSGEYQAYQAKFRSRRPALTWQEISTFMGLSDQVDQRVLFTNCDRLPKMLEDRSSFIPIRGSDLDRLTKTDFEAIRAWLQGGHVVREPKTPRSHQAQAISDILSGLAPDGLLRVGSVMRFHNGPLTVTRAVGAPPRAYCSEDAYGRVLVR